MIWFRRAKLYIIVGGGGLILQGFFETRIGGIGPVKFDAILGVTVRSARGRGGLFVRHPLISK